MDHYRYSHPCNWHNTNDRDELSEIPTNALTTTTGGKESWSGGCAWLYVRTPRSLRRLGTTCKHRKGSPQCETWETNCGSRHAREKNKVDHRRPTAIYEVAWISFSARMPNNGFARRPLKRDSEHWTTPWKAMHNTQFTYFTLPQNINVVDTEQFTSTDH